MRVLHVIHNLETGGAQVVLKSLVEGQRGTEVEPMIAVWKRGGPLLEDLVAAGESVHLCAPECSGSLLRTARWLCGVVDLHCPDVVHAHMPDSGFWGVVLAYAKGLPFVVSYYSNRLLFHTIDRASAYGRLRWALVRWGAKAAAANVACATSVRQTMVDELGLAEESIDVVHNGVPVPSDAEIARASRPLQRLQASTPGANIVTVGRLVDIKGQHQLVACAPRLLKRHPYARITIVGEGPRREEWQARAARLGVSHAVTFTGRVADPATFLREADVYVSPSRYEGISLGLLEAMSWGVPVVASEVAGNLDVITDGKDGLLYRLDDTDALADAIAQVLENAEAASERARAARVRVASQFSASAMCRGYESVYRNSIRFHRAGR